MRSVTVEDKKANGFLFVFAIIETTAWLVCLSATTIFAAMYVSKIGGLILSELQPFGYIPVVLCVFIMARSIQGLAEAANRVLKLHAVN